MDLGLLVSGGLGEKMLMHCLQQHQVKAVFTDKKSTNIQSISTVNDLPLFVGNPRNGRAAKFIHDHPIDLMLSINYLFIVEQDVIHWPRKGAVNFHGSLLPKYRGRTPHVWAIINNETSTGVTAHWMTVGCDEGDIIHQVVIPIDENDTGGSILRKYANIYPQIVDKVVLSYKEGEILSYPQDTSKASYFGKRMPDDGYINWNWQRERIQNWIRAQSLPYPGAFCYLDGKKIVIDEAQPDDFGFHQEQLNGLVITVDPVRVKTPNGVLQLTKIREGGDLIQKGVILN